MTTPDTETSRADREAAEKYAKGAWHIYEADWDDVRDAFLAGIKHGRAAERERAAHVADLIAMAHGSVDDSPGEEFQKSLVAVRIAAAIRAQASSGYPIY